MRKENNINPVIFEKHEKKLNRQTKRIIEEIAKSEPNGIHHIPLAEKTEIHRDTLRRDINNLIKFGYVKREGERGRYHLTKNAKQKSFVKGLFLNSHFISNILGKKGDIIFNDAITYIYKSKEKENSKEDQEYECEQENYYDSKDHYLKYFQPKFDANSEIEKILFEFINQIGAYFIFTFLSTLENNHKNKMEPLEKKDEEWLDGSINRVYIQSFNKFVEIFSNFEPNEKLSKELERYLKENKIEKNLPGIKGIMIQRAFFNIYPYIFYKLSKLTDRLKEDVEIFDKTRLDSFARFIKENRKD